MEIIRLESCDNEIFPKLVEWNYNWWGKKTGKSYEAVSYFLQNSLCKGDALPQTFVALVDGKPAGMYQLSMFDDLFGRPDIYPWIGNVYVDENFRGLGICGKLMETVPEKAKAAGLKEIYLYTNHVGLYEKYGWEFIEIIPTFDGSTQEERLYKLTI